MSSMLEIPGYAQGFAPRDGPPEYPGLRHNLVGSWHAPLGPSGLVLRDTSEYQTDLNFVGADGSDWVVGRHGWSIYLNGVNECLENTAPAEATNITDRLTIACWFRSTGSTLQSLVHHGHTSINYGYWLGFSDTTIYFYMTGVGNNTQAYANLRDGEIHHLVVTYDGANIYYHVDGVEVGSDVASGTISGTDTLRIGLVVDADDYDFKGEIISVAIWNAALPAAAVASLYRDLHALQRLRRQIYPAVAAAADAMPMAIDHYRRRRVA